MSIKEFLGTLVILVCVGIIYKTYAWYQENTILFWGIISLIVLFAVTLFVLYRLLKIQKERKMMADMPEKVREIKTLLDTFVTDIPKFSRHSEVSYQVDFGRYLKERLSGDTVVYEEVKDGVRPDIVVNKTIAIEIKALKKPNTKENREYNRLHVDSIFKKVHTYDVYEKVVIIIFNADYVKDKKWKDYEKMKEVVQQEGVVLFEK